MSFSVGHNRGETFSPDRANVLFSMRILPGRSRCGWVIAYASCLWALLKDLPVDTVAIPNEV